MLPASNKGAGMNMGFPDVCLTPAAPSPIPIPYPNMGMHAMAAPFCPTILLTMMPALNMGSMIPMTMGDDAGVAHPFFKQMGTFTMGNPKVFLQGLPAITLTSPTTGNNMNNPVGAVLVPSATNVMFTCAAPAADLVAMSELLARAGEVDTWLSGGVGTLVVRCFARGVASRVHASVTRLAAAGATSLVFDLRDNPGGELLAFVELARNMLPEGAVIATVTDAEGDAVVHRARGDIYGYPVTILVNRRTASAAELFAGCLQAHGRALLVGERTFGKGTAYALVAAPDGTARASVVASVSLPGDRVVDGRGVTPDIERRPSDDKQ